MLGRIRESLTELKAHMDYIVHVAPRPPLLYGFRYASADCMIEVAFTTKLSALCNHVVYEINQYKCLHAAAPFRSVPNNSLGESTNFHAPVALRSFRG